MKILTLLYNYVENLKERERYMLFIGGITTLIYFLYVGIYKPICHTLTYNEHLLTQQQLTLAYMDNVKRNIPQTSPARPYFTINQLLTNISRTLNTPSLIEFPHTLQKQDNNEIVLHFDKVPYIFFNQWLWDVQQKNPSLYIRKITIEKTDKEGIVKIDLIFKTGFQHSKTSLKQ